MGLALKYRVKEKRPLDTEIADGEVGWGVEDICPNDILPSTDPFVSWGRFSLTHAQIQTPWTNEFRACQENRAVSGDHCFRYRPGAYHWD